LRLRTGLGKQLPVREVVLTNSRIGLKPNVLVSTFYSKNKLRADKDAMEEFIHNLRIVLGTLGHRVLDPVKVVKQQVTDATSKPNLSEFTFRFSIRGLHATGQQTDDGFVLFKGSDVSGKTSKSMPGKTLAIQEKWIADGTLQSEGDNYRLTKDSILSSSSYAAVIVAGTSRSGPQSWIDEQGRSLKAVEEILLAET